jgi:hypothetical protein
MPIELVKDGDAGFVGLNSRDNPSSLPAGVVSKSENYRFDRGVARPRKGIERLFSGAFTGTEIYGSTTYVDVNGIETIVFVTGTQLYKYTYASGLMAPVAFPAGETITTSDGCILCQGMDKLFITRGHLKRPLQWDMATNIIALPSMAGVGHEFPNCTDLMYYGNRFIAQGKFHSEPNNIRRRDSVSVSNYLDFNDWDVLDTFTFNNGGNDQVIGIAPWTLNEFTVFMRNSIFYVNVGVGRYATGDALDSTCFIKTLVSDIGCIAKKSIVQANGGVIFLSDYGVYMMNPTQVGSNESMRLLTNAQPMSAPVDDIILRINKTYAHRSVAAYWNNRYYLAVPIDNSTKNNVVLVYNFILNAWESIDTYPAGIDIFNFAIAKLNTQRRLFIIDSNEGLFLTEELEYDEYGAVVLGIPTLDMVNERPRLPFSLGQLEFKQNQISSKLITRRYVFGTFKDKRFSSAEIDFEFDAGTAIKTFALVQNPDSSSAIDNYGSPTNNDETRRIPLRKIGTGVQLSFVATNKRPTIRSAAVYSKMNTKNIQTKK